MAAGRKRSSARVAHRKRVTKASSSPACYLHEFEAEQASGRAPDVRIKRIYEPATREDGFRVLVDRLWPRGFTKERAALDAWARELAPSPALRKWFGHDPKRMSAFRERYRAELAGHAVELGALRQRAAEQRVTLLYAARDARCNHAAVLEEVIREAEAVPPYNVSSRT
jgi:uncharacterized protein YeaO (DUF488 family)